MPGRSCRTSNARALIIKLAVGSVGVSPATDQLPTGNDSVIESIPACTCARFSSSVPEISASKTTSTSVVPVAAIAAPTSDATRSAGATAVNGSFGANNLSTSVVDVVGAVTTGGASVAVVSVPGRAAIQNPPPATRTSSATQRTSTRSRREDMRDSDRNGTGKNGRTQPRWLHSCNR